MSFLYGVRSYHCEKIHFVRCYTFKKQGCNIEHSKNKNQICGKSSLKTCKKDDPPRRHLRVRVVHRWGCQGPVQGHQGLRQPLLHLYRGGTNSFTWPSKPDIILTSVADPDPGSGAFLTPGSGIRNGFFPDLGSRIPRPYFEELFGNFFGKKFDNSLKIGPNFFL